MAAGVEFKETFSDKQNVSPQGMAGDGVSLITVAQTAENALLFVKNPEDVAATTRVFFDGRGKITEGTRKTWSKKGSRGKENQSQVEKGR